MSLLPLAGIFAQFCGALEAKPACWRLRDGRVDSRATRFKPVERSTPATSEGVSAHNRVIPHGGRAKPLAEKATTKDTMLATPEAADWAEHPAARAGKLEKRGRLSHWPASDGARQASWPRMQAPAKSANLSKFGASMRARVQVSYAALADIRGRRRWAARRRTAETFQRPAVGLAATTPAFRNVSRRSTRGIGVISRADGLWPLIISSLCFC